MQNGAAAELLACSPMLCGLGSELLSAIILRGDTVRFSAGQPVTLAGTPAESAIYVLEGRIALPDQDAEDITPGLEPGAGLSEMAMFVEMDHYHNAIALEDVVVLQISRELMGHLVFERPVLAECFANNIRNNLTNIARKLHELDAMLDRSSLPEPEPDHQQSMEMAALEFQPQAAEGYGTLQLPGLPQISMDAQEGNFSEADTHFNDEMPVRDIMMELSQFTLQPDQTPPEPAHGQTAFPSLASHQ